MSRILILTWALLGFVTGAGVAMAGDPDFRLISLGPQSAAVEPGIDFLEQAPVIDGRLDDSLKFLPVRQFSFAYVMGNDAVVPTNFRLAYGTDFFYVYIEVAGDKLICRDRAYQHGDGFHMVIAAPKPNNAPTDEFYVLACSAVDKPSLEWTRRVFWYYNVDRIFVPTSESARLESRQENGKVCFELLLPWADVHPYHPWLSGAMGFNLKFVKAVEPDRVMVFGILDDPHIDSEQQKREYVTLSFKAPVVRRTAQMFAQSMRGHISVGDSLEVATAGIAPDSIGSELTVGVYSGEGERLLAQRVPLSVGAAVERSSIWVGTSTLPVGGCTVRWSLGSGSCHGERGLTVLPAADMTQLERRIDSIAGRISVSSASTLRFLAGEIKQKLESIHSYETCADLRTALNGLLSSIEHAEQGSDDFAVGKGFVRKAYRSAVDSTLQPYMVWLPADYDGARKYPLMVYLHGSASDEKSFSRRGARDVIPEGFIGVAPYGRGKSNVFCYDHAQEDIAEVIDAVSRDYAVDTGAILLTGFSMGGYGVLRTAYETPKKFKALAIFSGDPNLGRKCSDDGVPPNFEKRENLKIFKHCPVFVFHGEQDKNASFEGTKAMVENLRRVGAEVLFVTEPEKGHDFPAAPTVKRFFEWVAGHFATVQ